MKLFAEPLIDLNMRHGISGLGAGTREEAESEPGQGLALQSPNQLTTPTKMAVIEELDSILPPQEERKMKARPEKR
jgi:hypothetical protein